MPTMIIDAKALARDKQEATLLHVTSILNHNERLCTQDNNVQESQKATGPWPDASAEAQTGPLDP